MDNLLNALADATGFAKGFLITLIASLVGRVMHHARQVQRGHRRFLSWHLLWELPVALGMGLIGDSAAQGLELSEGLRVGFIAAFAYLGPHVIDEVFVAGRDAVRSRIGAPDKN